MDKKTLSYQSIYCQNEQHYQAGEPIKYLMIKKGKGLIQKRLLCNQCFLGEYASCQQYCCQLDELLNGNIFEAFKNTKFDSEIMQMLFNYLSRLHLYINEDYIIEIIQTLRAEFDSAIEDLQETLLDKSRHYKKYLEEQKYDELCLNHFGQQELRNIFQETFYRSPQNWAKLNKLIEDYVTQINMTEIDKQIEEKITETIQQQKSFFNLERLENSMKELLNTVVAMQEKTFSEYQFSQSTLATPYIDKILEKINSEQKEKIQKNSRKLFRLTQNGRDFTQLQKITELKTNNTLTIIQTKNKQVFGVYNDVSEQQNSFLFQMNKEKIFQIKKGKKPLEVNFQANQDSWILRAGEGDIVINSSFSSCSSTLNTGFDTDGVNIFNHLEYLANSKEFDIYDLEIFQIPSQDSPQKPPNQSVPARQFIGQTMQPQTNINNVIRQTQKNN